MASRKILFVIGSLNLGGAERHLALIAPRLKALGWDPTIYCISSTGTQAEEVRRCGVDVIGPPWEGGPGRSTAGKLLRLFASCLKLFKILVFDRPAICHFFLPLAYVVGAPLAIVAGTPTLIMSRRSLNNYQDQHPFLARLEHFLHRRMDAILCNSRAVFAQLLDEGCAHERLKIIYNGIDLERINRARSAPTNRAAPGLILIIIANLIRYKGHRDVIAGLAKVKGQMPPEWTLFCIGRDDGLRGELERLVEQTGLKGHIAFVGEQKNAENWAANGDIGILCSHEEGFSNAALECMAAGLPMVVTNVGGNSEAVIHGESGIVVPPRDVDAIGQAILKLAIDPDSRRCMGTTARNRIEQNFSIARCVDEYDGVYRGLLEKR